VLTPADEIHHINKHNFKVPFVCGCRDLGEALRRIAEGAAMIRTKVGDAGMACVTWGWPVCVWQWQLQFCWDAPVVGWDAPVVGWKWKAVSDGSWIKLQYLTAW
jgi:hypothetical protein